MTRVRIENLTFAYPGAPAILKGLSAIVELPEGGGHIAALVGPSGCGKTTLLKLIAGTERPLSGTLMLEPSGATISYLPQDSSILEHLSAREAVYLFNEIAATRHLFNKGLVEEVIDELETRDLIEGSVPHSRLSGGEKRRLALARALSINPRLLLLDEPCSGLDHERKISFLKLLRQTVDRHDVIAIYVTHHADEVDLVSDSIMYMRSADGSVSELANVPTEQFRNCPPGLDAAQFVLGYDYSAMQCIISGAQIRTTGGKTLASTIGHSGVQGPAIVMFAAGAVVPRAGGLPTTVVGRSSQYAILKVDESTSLFSKSVFDSPACEVGLSGTVLVFGKPHAAAQRVICV